MAGKRYAVLADLVVAGEHEVSGTLALTGIGIDIGAYESGALTLDEVVSVGCLAGKLIACAYVGNHSGTVDGVVHAGRIRYPEVLADLAGQSE